VTLPIATIKRILDRVTSLPGQASEFVPGTRLRRNEPLNFGLFPRAVDKSPQTGIELSAEEDEEESAAFWRYPPVSTSCAELFRDPA
jgi:hypothetical protein